VIGRLSSAPGIAAGFAVYVDKASPTEWSELLSRFDDASIYQSWAYGSVHWGQRQLSHLVLEQESNVVAMAQVRLVQLPLIQKGIAYIRWGPLCRSRRERLDPKILSHVTQAIKKEYVERRGLLLRMLPPVFENDSFAESWEATWSSLGIGKIEKAQGYRTMRVDLDLALDDLRKNLHQRWRNYLKSAEKGGFSVREGTAIEFYDQFLTAYQEMMARKRFETTVDVHEFRRIQLELPEQLRMQVFLCERDGKLLNALVVAAAGDTGIYLLAATSNEGLDAKGAHLLQWRAMEWLKARGCRCYDLGGINQERNPGVFQFKSGLGGREEHQLGVFEASGNWLSTICVRVGEQVQSLRGRFQTCLKRTPL
jgi:lipid II:glycine glycyltransferase (peptidoglycan interpeptide bridge formation enzyme)